MTTLLRQIITTADGSSSIYIPEMDEHYHSTHGAIQEAKHVYLNNGLKYHQSDELNIFEVGFGTGLNTFLTYIENLDLGKKIHYDSIERYPLTQQEINQLNYTSAFESKYENVFEQLHQNENSTIEISNLFSFSKIIDNLKNYSFTKKYDIIYFDAFAPNKQDDLWSIDIFHKIYNACNTNAILTTYCAKGQVRRTMIEAGFTVERIPGPPGKLQMLRAIKK